MNLVMKKGNFKKVLILPFLATLIAFMSLPTSAFASHSDNFANPPTIGYGRYESGEYVEFVQAFLNMNYYGAGSTDGIYGPNTKQAIEEYQSDHGLSVDGIVGPNTWNSIESHFYYPYGDVLRSKTGYQVMNVDTSSDYWNRKDVEYSGYVLDSGYLR